MITRHAFSVGAVDLCDNCSLLNLQQDTALRLANLYTRFIMIHTPNICRGI